LLGKGYEHCHTGQTWRCRFEPPNATPVLAKPKIAVLMRSQPGIRVTTSMPPLNSAHLACSVQVYSSKAGLMRRVACTLRCLTDRILFFCARMLRPAPNRTHLCRTLPWLRVPLRPSVRGHKPSALFVTLSPTCEPGELIPRRRGLNPRRKRACLSDLRWRRTTSETIAAKD